MRVMDSDSTMVLIDTNVVSEIMRATPHKRVLEFLNDGDELWLSSILIHELEYGVQRLPRGRKRLALRNSMRNVLTEYRDRILDVDAQAAVWAARFRAQARSLGRALDLGDALIAGTARSHELAIATRNVRDFAGLDISVVNPWDAR